MTQWTPILPQGLPGQSTKDLCLTKLVVRFASSCQQLQALQGGLTSGAGSAGAHAKFPCSFCEKDLECTFALGRPRDPFRGRRRERLKPSCEKWRCPRESASRQQEKKWRKLMTAPSSLEGAPERRASGPPAASSRALSGSSSASSLVASPVPDFRILGPLGSG